jgi:mRNA interferase MazF
MLVKRGDIYFANLAENIVGSEQGGPRPVLVIQNNIGNKFSPTTIVAVFTAKVKKAKLPTHIEFEAGKYQLHSDSLLMLEQIKTIDKSRLVAYINNVATDVIMSKIDLALEISLGLTLDKFRETYNNVASLMRYSRGEIYFAELEDKIIGSEQGGQRPVMILQNDVGNRFSPTVIVAVFTTKIKKSKLPTHIEFDSREFGLHDDSLLMLEQIKTIDKSRLKKHIIKCESSCIMDRINSALSISVGLVNVFK